VTAAVLGSDLSGGDVAAIIVAVLTAIAVVFLCIALASLTKTMRTLRETVELLRRETLPVVANMQSTVNQANAELERVDTLLGTAESISATVDSASRLAYLALSNPVIKVMAVGAGTARAARRFRRPKGTT
jgi:uncharacterized protein YoxC